MKYQLNRRRLLSSLSKLVWVPALPFWGAPTARAATPRRILFVYLPNGIQWQPAGTGAPLTLSGALQPLAPFKDYVTVVSGVNLPTAKDSRAGDHARAGGSFLTAVKPGFPGPGVQRSLDLLIADRIGKNTPHGILSLGGEGASSSDAGYSDSYQSHISWADAKSPFPKETSPQAVFNRLFSNVTPAASSGGGSSGAASNRQQEDKSVLDFALKETEALRAKLSAEDRLKLDEYFNSLRELESRIHRSSEEGGTELACTKPTANFQERVSYDQKISQFYDVIFHALQCGMTRVVTLILANEASGISYPFAGVSGSHHEISHDASSRGRDQLAQIVRWHTGALAQLVGRLQKTQEGSGTMLDHTLILYGSGIADGARHTHDNLPLVVIGRDTSVIPGGRHINAQGAPLANLHLTLAKALGVSLNTFGDSSGLLPLS